MYRYAAVLAATTLVTGCTAARLAGFDEMATAGQLALVEMTKVPAWRDGSFRLGTATGHVRRRAQYDAVGWGPDGAGGAYDNVRYGEAVKFGKMTFELDSPDVGGRLEARCRYGRSEVRGRVAGIDLAEAATPLTLGCAYRIDGRDAGWLDLGAVPAGGNAEGRVGTVAVNGMRLMLSSDHRIAGIPFDVGEAAGYTARSEDGRTVGALDLAGGGGCRLLLPRDPAQRTAAAVALVTMALFWDPGDVG